MKIYLFAVLSCCLVAGHAHGEFPDEILLRQCAFENQEDYKKRLETMLYAEKDEWEHDDDYIKRIQAIFKLYDKITTQEAELIKQKRQKEDEELFKHNVATFNKQKGNAEWIVYVIKHRPIN